MSNAKTAEMIEHVWRRYATQIADAHADIITRVGRLEAAMAIVAKRLIELEQRAAAPAAKNGSGGSPPIDGQPKT